MVTLTDGTCHYQSLRYLLCKSVYCYSQTLACVTTHQEQEITP